MAITRITSAPESSPATLAAALSKRRHLKIYNHSDSGTLYFAYSSTVSNASYSLPVAPGGYWEMPKNGEFAEYDGAITAYWSPNQGYCMVTEF